MLKKCCNIMAGGRFTACSIPRSCRLCGGCGWKTRYCTVTSIVMLGCIFVLSNFLSNFLLITTDADPPCYAGRFEAGEDALMPTIRKWTKEWLELLGYNDSEMPQDLRPCKDNSAIACQSINCSRSLQWDVLDRIGREMFDVDFVLTMEHIVRVQCLGDSVPVSDVIILTTASSNQFGQVQTWLQHVNRLVVPEIMESVGTAQVVVVEMGLNSKQINKLRRRCQCTVVTFPYWSFPAHVNDVGNCSARRPIIIRAFLSRVRLSVIYSDPDTVIQPGHTKHLMHRVNSTGVLFQASSPIALPVHTHQKTFDFFREDPCAFYPFGEIPLNFGIFRNTSYVSRVLVEPWVNCALTPGCVCPVLTDKPCPEHLHSNRVGQCHKSDQSVLNILLSKIFRFNVHRVTLQKKENFVRTLAHYETAPFADVFFNNSTTKSLLSSSSNETKNNHNSVKTRR